MVMIDGIDEADYDLLPDYLKEDSVVESPFGFEDIVLPIGFESPSIWDYSVEGIKKASLDSPPINLTKKQRKTLDNIKADLYNWGAEPSYSDIFHKEFCKKNDISLSVLKTLEKKGLIMLAKDDYYFKTDGYIIYAKPLMYAFYITEEDDFPEWFIPEAKEKGLWKAESKKINPLEKAGISGIASGATMEGLETLMAAEEESTEVFKLSSYFSYLKSQKPDLAREIEFSVKNEGELPSQKIYDAGFNPSIIEEWVDLVGVEDEKLQGYESCSNCEGEGYVLTSYTPATRYEPADGDGEDCGECDGTGMIDPADYMDKKGQYYAETFEAKQIGSIRIAKNPNFPSGTSLQAYIKTNRAELRKVFGNPNMGESGDGKSKGKEWNLIVGNHRVTIYDKREKDKKGTKYFNIGGSGMFGALLVAQALSIHRNEQVYAKETVPQWLEDERRYQRVKSIDEHPDLTYERAKEYEDNRGRYGAETLSKTSCCCGADEANPCACMKAPEPMNCSAKAPKCACYKALEKNAEYDEEDMVYCKHCSDIVGNEKEVYGDETVEYEMANGELVCLPCHKIWMKEYKNDLDPHYSPFYAEQVQYEVMVGDIENAEIVSLYETLEKAKADANKRAKTTDLPIFVTENRYDDALSQELGTDIVFTLNAETKLSKTCPNCEKYGMDATTDYICDMCAQCKGCCETSYGCYDVAICNDCDGSFIGKDIDGCCGSCDDCCECDQDPSMNAEEKESIFKNTMFQAGSLLLALTLLIHLRK